MLEQRMILWIVMIWNGWNDTWAFITPRTSQKQYPAFLIPSHKQEKFQQPKVSLQSSTKESTSSSSETFLVPSIDKKNKLDLRLVLIDNYDSYTYNLYSYFATICQSPPIVITNNLDSSIYQSILSEADGIIISPGPGSPTVESDMGICLDVIRHYSKKPILGVCLGHQAIGHVYGAKVQRTASGPVHGRLSNVQYYTSQHQEDDHFLFQGLPQNFPVTRYHSLEVVFPGPSKILQVESIAWCHADHTNEVVCMALQHKEFPHFGVQFHPESIATGSYGYALLQNFCQYCLEYKTNIKPHNGQTYKNGYQVNQLQRHPLPISSEKIKKAIETNDVNSNFKVWIQQIDNVQNIQLTTQDVFEQMGYHHSELPSFWLDSSNFDKENNGGRFSIFGTSESTLEYYGMDHEESKRGIYHQINGITKRMNHDTNLISYLQTNLLPTTTFSFSTARSSSECEEDVWIECEEETNDPNSMIPFTFRGGYVGYFGYEFRHDTRDSICQQELCQLPPSSFTSTKLTGNSNVPTAAFLFADRTIVYDHWNNQWYTVGVTSKTEDVKNEKDIKEWMDATSQQIRTMSPTRNNEENPIKFNDKDVEFKWDRSKEQYLKDVHSCQEKILSGESYELCLTNQMHASVSRKEKNPYQMYRILRKRNPAPYSAFLHSPNQFSICCSSPERFLSITATEKKSGNNHMLEYIVESKPIKGTCARWKEDPKIDALLAEELRTCVKNRAENLMIVDLLRNDLSRVCKTGSVQVPKLMQVESFETVHQLVSTIRGTLSKDNTMVDVFTACFPGGSMTGAPKLRSVDILQSLEQNVSRGPYSGSLGYFSLNGCMDMNILIRSAIFTPSNRQNGQKNDHTKKLNDLDQWDISVGAGGAITILSDADDEWNEIILKSKAIKESIQQWANSSPSS